MHHATKKALVAKYNELLAAGASMEEIRSGLKGEEKVEGKEDLAEILEALDEHPAPPHHSPKGEYTVEKTFREISDFSKEWQKGDDVSHFDQFRLESLVELGLVKKGK